MSRSIELGRQEAEELVDLLEEQPDRMLHVVSAQELAAEIRIRFGMSPATSASLHAELTKLPALPTYNVVKYTVGAHGPFAYVVAPIGVDGSTGPAITATQVNELLCELIKLRAAMDLLNSGARSYSRPPLRAISGTQWNFVHNHPTGEVHHVRDVLIAAAMTLSENPGGAT